MHRARLLPDINDRATLTGDDISCRVDHVPEVATPRRLQQQRAPRGCSSVRAVASDAVAARRSARVERRLLRGGEPVILDALHLASRVPVAFLFMPLAGGESHTPEEHATAEDVELAGAVLVDLMAASVLEQLD